MLRLCEISLLDHKWYHHHLQAATRIRIHFSIKRFIKHLLSPPNYCAKHLKTKIEKVTHEVPTVAQEDQCCLGSTGSQVWSSAWHSWLRIWYWGSCGLGSNCGSDLIPGLGTPCSTGRPKKKKRKKFNPTGEGGTMGAHGQSCTRKDFVLCEAGSDGGAHHLNPIQL